jgi:hypothetical protein
MQFGIERLVEMLGETTDGVNRLYYAPPVHIHGSLSINDVSLRPLPIVTTSRKAKVFAFDQWRSLHTESVRAMNVIGQTK